MMTFKLISLLTVLSVLPFVQAIELQSGLALSFYACSNDGYVTNVTSNDANGFTCSEGASPVEVPLTNVNAVILALSCKGKSDGVVVGFLTATSDNADPPQLTSSTYSYFDQEGALSPYSHVPICTKAAFLNLVLSISTFNGSGFDCYGLASIQALVKLRVLMSHKLLFMSAYVTGVTSYDVDGFNCSSGASPVEVTLNGLVHEVIVSFYENIHIDSIVIGFLTDTTTIEPSSSIDPSTYLTSHTLVYTRAIYLNLSASYNELQTSSISDGCSSSAWFDFDTDLNVAFCVAVTQIPTISSALSDRNYYDPLRSLDCPYAFFNSFNATDGSSSQCQRDNYAMPVYADIFIDAENIIDAENGNSTFRCGTKQAALRILGNYHQDVDFFMNLFNDGGSKLLCANVQLDSHYSLVESESMAMGNSTINFNCTNVGNYTSTGFLKSITQQSGGSDRNYFYTCLFLVPAANNDPVISHIVPVVSNIALVESSIVPVERSIVPVERSIVPVESSIVPVESSIVPVESSNPVASNMVLVQSSIVPVESGIVPVESSDPVVSNIVLVQSSIVPVESTIHVPVVSGNVPVVSSNSTNSSDNLTDIGSSDTTDTTDCDKALTYNGNGKYFCANSNQYNQGSQQNQGNYGNYNQGAQQNQEIGNYGNYNQLSKLSVSGIANLLSDAASINVYLFATLAMSTIFSLSIVFH